MKRQANAATYELVQAIFTDENKKTIGEETALMPEIIAEGITQNKSEILYLVNRAEMHYQNSDQFKKAITAKGNKGRDNLYMFMDHWLDAYRKNVKRIANHFKI